MYPAPPKICTASIVTFIAMSLAKHFAIEALAENDLNAAVGFESGIRDAGAVVNQRTGGFDVHCHVCQHEL